MHIFAPDGLNSIAGIDVDVEGGDNIIALFAQWGWEQLLLALIAWVIITKCSLVPLAAAAGPGLGRPVGCREFKPFVVDAPPPGAIGNLIFLPLSDHTVVRTAEEVSGRFPTKPRIRSCPRGVEPTSARPTELSRPPRHYGPGTPAPARPTTMLPSSPTTCRRPEPSTLPRPRATHSPDPRPGPPTATR